MVKPTELAKMSETLKQKREELEKLNLEVRELEIAVRKHADTFLADLGISVQPQPVAKPRKGGKARKTSPRWRLRAILEIINENDGISKEELRTKLEAEKPGANLDKLDGYLEEYTNNGPKLMLNPAGKEQLK